jgi:GT2 family glycosyltransferase
MYDGDVDLCARMAVEGWKGYLMSDVRILHHGGLSSTADSKQQMMRIGRHAYYRKWHGHTRALALRGALSTTSTVKRFHRHLGTVKLP